MSNYKYVVALLLLFSVAASVQAILLGTKKFGSKEISYTHYNNYKIFKHSFFHLSEGKDLYKSYPREHHDLFKYSPTFAALFGVFAVFPDWVGLNLWNLLNAIVLLLAVYYLPNMTNYQKGLVLVLSVIELMTSMQNAQSNGLIAGLTIFAFGFMEREKPFWAAFSIVFSVFIKLFGLVGFAIFLFYPKKLKLALYTLFWFAVMALVPLLFVDLETYQGLFVSWGDMLSNDYSTSYGYSVMGWLHSWFGFEMNKYLVILLGVIVFLIPLTRIKMYKNFTFRFLTLASVLIWVVIFNHKAESPTFIIAMAGVALWFVTAEKTPFHIVLFVSAFIFTSLSPTDIIPRVVREEFMKPYMLKVLPCIIIWGKVVYEMLTLKEDRIIPVNVNKKVKY